MAGAWQDKLVNTTIARMKALGHDAFDVEKVRAFIVQVADLERANPEEFRVGAAYLMDYCKPRTVEGTISRIGTLWSEIPAEEGFKLESIPTTGGATTSGETLSNGHPAYIPISTSAPTSVFGRMQSPPPPPMSVVPPPPPSLQKPESVQPPLDAKPVLPPGPPPIPKSQPSLPSGPVQAPSNSSKSTDMPTGSMNSAQHGTHEMSCVVACRVRGPAEGAASRLNAFLQTKPAIGARITEGVKIHDRWVDMKLVYTVNLAEIYEVILESTDIEDAVTKPLADFGRRTVATVQR